MSSLRLNPYKQITKPYYRSTRREDKLTDFSLPPRRISASKDRFISDRTTQNDELSHYLLTSNSPDKLVTHQDKDDKTSSQLSDELFRVIFNTGHSLSDLNPSSGTNSARVSSLFDIKKKRMNHSRITSTNFKIASTPLKVKDLPDFVGDANTSNIGWSDEDKIFGCSLGSEVYILRGLDCEPEKVVGMESEGEISGLSWSGNNRIACSTSSGWVFIVDCNRSDAPSGFNMVDRTTRSSNLSWNKGNSLLSVATTKGDIGICDLRTPRQFTNHFNASKVAIPGLSWSPNYRLFANCDENGQVKIWDLNKLNAPLLCISAHENMYKALAWCPWEPSVLATGGGFSDPTIKTWNSSTSCLTRICITNSPVSSLVWSSERKELVSTHCGAPCVAFWSHSTLELEHRLSWYNNNSVFTGVISPDGITFAATSSNESVGFWEISRLCKLPTTNFNSRRGSSVFCTQNVIR